MPNKNKKKVVAKQNGKKAKTKRTLETSQPINLRKIGAQLGSYLGASAGSLVGRVFGMGAYTVQRNVLLDAHGVVGPPPQFSTATDGSVVVCAREFIIDVQGTTNFSRRVTQCINPANQFLFPRLSQIAPNFEEYEFLGLIFEFNTTSGTAVGSTNTALGTVIMATNYDSADPPFQSKQEMESYMFSTSVVPCNSIIHPIECAAKPAVGANPSQTLYVGTYPNIVYIPNAVDQGGCIVGPGLDQRLYNKGLFQLATAGMQATNVVGELWVSYCVRLKVPRMNPALLSAHISTTSNTGTAAAPFAGAILTYGSTLPLIFNSSTVTIPVPGRYMIFAVAYTGTATSVWTITAQGANITNLNSQDTSGGLYATNGVSIANSGQNAAVIQAMLNVDAPGTGVANTLGFAGPGGMTAGNVDLFVLPVTTVSGGGPTTTF